MPLSEPWKDDPFTNHPTLFAGAVNSSCGIHVDGQQANFWQAVLAGRKIFRVFALPEEWRRILFYQTASLPGFPADPKDEDEHEQFPLLGVARRYEVEFEARKGDLIFIPGGTAYHERNP